MTTLKVEGAQPDTALLLSRVADCFSIGTTSTKNELMGEQDFVKFSSEEPVSFSTLLGLKELFSALQIYGMVLVSGALVFQVPEGSLEMRLGVAGGKYIRVRCSVSKEEPFLTLNEKNAPEAIIHALQNLYNGMQKDVKLISE